MSRESHAAWVDQTGRVGALLSALGVVVWASGLPFLFPSLGPTAYLYATRPSAPACTPRRVLGGHAVGVAAGLVAYHTVAGGVVITASMTAGAPGTLRLAASGVVAAMLTTVGMLATDTRHAPACATTLIVGLGILPSLREGGIILAAVAVLAVEHALVGRLFE